MVHIVFRNTDQLQPVAETFRASGVRMASDCIYAVINGREIPLATGTGSLWRVGSRFFNNVEIVSSTLRVVKDDRKAA